MSSSATIEFWCVPEWEADSISYCERHSLYPDAWATEMAGFVDNPDSLDRADSDVFGLRIAALSAPNGGGEHLVAIYYEDVSDPLLVLIGILRAASSDLRVALQTSEWKRRINTAVSKIIQYQRLAEDL